MVIHASVIINSFLTSFHTLQNLHLQDIAFWLDYFVFPEQAAFEAPNPKPEPAVFPSASLFL